MRINDAGRLVEDVTCAGVTEEIDLVEHWDRVEKAGPPPPFRGRYSCVIGDETTPRFIFRP